MYIDLKSIRLKENGEKPEVVTISEKDGFFLNTSFSNDFRIRKSVYDKLKQAQEKLPAGYFFEIYEAYRPLKRQVDLWNMAQSILREKHPEANDQELYALTDTFVADPHNGIGSGHQACCAVDISLCDAHQKGYDMGTKCQEISPLAPTLAQGISEEARKNRTILVDALESTGMINYPEEWWHFSYGDHQWAFLKGLEEAVYGPIDI